MEGSGTEGSENKNLHRFKLPPIVELGFFKFNGRQKFKKQNAHHVCQIDLCWKDRCRQK